MESDIVTKCRPSWLKAIKLLPDYFYLSIVRSSEFKFSFYAYLFLYIAQIIFYLMFWNMVQPPQIDGWSKEACFLLTGFATLNVALQEIIWATGMIDMMILHGDLMVVLVRPENSYFGLVLRRMGAMAVIPAFLGFTVVVVTLLLYFEFYLLQLALACTICLLGAVCMRALMLSVNSLAFKYGRVTALKNFVLSSRDLSRYPLSLLPFGLTSFLSTLFPVLLVSNWPTKLMLLDNIQAMLELIGLALVVTFIWVSAAVFFWRRGLRVYEGQSL